MPPDMAFPSGVVLGQVELFGILPVSEVADETFAMGPWCWLLSDPRWFSEPAECKGRLSLFTVDSAIVLPRYDTQLRYANTRSVMRIIGAGVNCHRALLSAR